MKRSTQVRSNPFPYSDSNKRYYTYDYYLKQTFGGKCAKIPLDAGLTCPNIDGLCNVSEMRPPDLEQVHKSSEEANYKRP